MTNDHLSARRLTLARWLDGVIALLAVAWLHAELTGGARWELGPLSLSNRDSSRVLIDLLVVFGLRHVMLGTPSTFQRVRNGFSAIDRTRVGLWLHARISGAPLYLVVFQAVVITRVFVFGIGWYSVVTAMPSGDGYRDVVLAEAQEAPVEFLHMRWDAGWYTSIAIGGGYTWNPATPAVRQNVAFFPAFPLLQRWATHVLDDAAEMIGHPTMLGRGVGVRATAVGVLLNVVLFGSALVLLGKLTALDFGAAGGNAAVVLAAAAPFSIFFTAPYTESLLLLSVLGAFYYQRRLQPWPALLCGVIAGLTKQTGWLLAAPLAIAVWQRGRSDAGKPTWLDALVIMGPVIGACSFSAYLWWKFGDPLAWLHAQQAWDTSPRWLHLAAAGPFAYARWYPYEALNLLAVIVAVPLIWRSRSIQWSYVAFGLATITVPLIVGVVPLGRMTAVAFPIYIVAAGRIRSTSMLLMIAGVLFALQLVAAYQFYGWRTLY